MSLLLLFLGKKARAIFPQDVVGPGQYYGILPIFKTVQMHADVSAYPFATVSQVSYVHAVATMSFQPAGTWGITAIFGEVCRLGFILQTEIQRVKFIRCLVQVAGLWWVRRGGRQTISADPMTLSMMPGSRVVHASDGDDDDDDDLLTITEVL